MSTIERDWDIDPDPDPTPLPRRTRRPVADNDQGWQTDVDRYQRHLDRMGGE